MPAEKKKKKKKAAKAPEQIEHTPDQLRLLELLPLLKETERKCRERYQSISGYQINRSTSEAISLGDLLHELQALEAEAAALLDALDHSEVADLAVYVAQLLDAGSHGFFSGSRRSQGNMVLTAARRALCRRSAKDEEGEEGDDESQSSGSHTSHKEGEASRERAEASEQRRLAAESEEQQLRVENLVSAFAAAGLLVLCVQLWAPARDGNHAALARLLEMRPWTVDEPGRQGQGASVGPQPARACLRAPSPPPLASRRLLTLRYQLLSASRARAQASPMRCKSRARLVMSSASSCSFGMGRSSATQTGSSRRRVRAQTADRVVYSPHALHAHSHTRAIAMRAPPLLAQAPLCARRC